MSIDWNELTAISPLDGRYRSKTAALGPILSEAGLIEKRIYVEIAWLLFLAKSEPIAGDINLSDTCRQALERWIDNIRPEDVLRVKEIEAETNHDVKAVEYLLREKLQEFDAPERVAAFLHFACTSEDINNLSYALMLQEARRDVILPALNDIQTVLQDQAASNAEMAMLSRTHGQTASPTTLGKEFAVFAHRLGKLVNRLRKLPIEGKMNGAVGNFNAHLLAYPEADWPALAQAFVAEHLHLNYNPLTTQIENHDSMVALISCTADINTLLIGLCRDLWTYISMDYFKLAVKAGEVGSSTMPHKVNPIDFENAEGNFGVAVGLGRHLCDKLPISRLQRDLTDSTVQRTLGSFFGHSLLAYRSLSKGLSKLQPNESAIREDLCQSWEVLAEAVQTVMRRYGIVDAYERLKQATRGKPVDAESLQTLIQGTKELPEKEKKRLLDLRPETYIGLAAKLARQCGEVSS